MSSDLSSKRFVKRPVKRSVLARRVLASSSERGWRSQEVRIGTLTLGGGQPVRLQSMITAAVEEPAAALEEMQALQAAGCELVRVTVPTRKSVAALPHLRRRMAQTGIDMPLIADIHFNPALALAVTPHVDKVRINPGNFGTRSGRLTPAADESNADHAAEPLLATLTSPAQQDGLNQIRQQLVPLVKALKQHDVALRVGVNHGSLSERITARFGDSPRGMVASALEFLYVLEQLDYRQTVVSMKSSNPQVMLRAYHLLVREMQQGGMAYPLHLGVTEAGDGLAGRLKSAVGIGALLLDGLGDTVRVSLTEAPAAEIPVARALAQLKRAQLKRVQSPRRAAVNLTQAAAAQVDVPRVAAAQVDVSRVAAAQVDVSRVAAAQVDLTQVAVPRVAAAHFQRRESQDAVSGGVLVGSAHAVRCFALHGADIQGAAGGGAPGFGWQAAAEPFDGRLRAPRASWTTSAGSPQQLPSQQLLSVEQALVCVRTGKIPGGGVLLDEADLQADAWPALLVPAAAPRLLIYCGRDKKGALEHLAHTLDARHAPWPLAVVLETPPLKLDAATELSLGVPGQDDPQTLTQAAEIGALAGAGLLDAVLAESGGRDDPTRAAAAYYARTLLQAARLRTYETEYISCPSCGRTLFDLQATTARIKARTSHLRHLKIGIMGCIVNGPGEMADADFGYVGGAPGKINLYRGQRCVMRGIPTEEAVDRLVELIRTHDQWTDPPQPEPT